MKKKVISIVLLVSLMLSCLAFSSCAAPDPSECDSLRLYHANDAAVIHQHMKENGYQEDEYTVVERFVSKYHVFLFNMISYGGSSFPHVPGTGNKYNHYSVYIHAEERVLSFLIDNGKLTEEETSPAQTTMIERAVQAQTTNAGNMYMFLFYHFVNMPCENVNSVYCFEESEGAAKYVYLETNVGPYILFTPGEEYGLPWYFIPHYSYNVLAESIGLSEVRSAEAMAKWMENADLLEPYKMENPSP